MLGGSLNVLRTDVSSGSLNNFRIKKSSVPASLKKIHNQRTITVLVISKTLKNQQVS
jgi:hypothetical protein